MLRLVVGLVLPASLLCACSDDGVAADGDSQTQDTSASADDGTGMTTDPSGTNPTATDPDTATVTDPTGVSSDSGADDAPGTSDGTAGSTGGTADGTGDDTSGSSDTGPAPAEECVTLSDCVVVDDCCNCMAIHEDEAPPECDIKACLQSTCQALGIPAEAACEVGSCEIAPVPCNPSDVFCESLPPDCEDGFVPGVNPEANCWTGTCVPAEYCDIVPACEDCPDDEACVQYVTQLGPQFHCSPIPESCDGNPSCACMGEACIAPFDSCGDGGMGLSCSCPVCD